MAEWEGGGNCSASLGFCNWAPSFHFSFARTDPVSGPVPLQRDRQAITVSILEIGCLNQIDSDRYLLWDRSCQSDWPSDRLQKKLNYCSIYVSTKSLTRDESATFSKYSANIVELCLIEVSIEVSRQSTVSQTTMLGYRKPSIFIRSNAENASNVGNSSNLKASVTMASSRPDRHRLLGQLCNRKSATVS